MVSEGKGSERVGSRSNTHLTHSSGASRATLRTTNLGYRVPLTATTAFIPLACASSTPPIKPPDSVCGRTPATWYPPHLIKTNTTSTSTYSNLRCTLKEVKILVVVALAPKQSGRHVPGEPLYMVATLYDNSSFTNTVYKSFTKNIY